MPGAKLVPVSIDLRKSNLACTSTCVSPMPGRKFCGAGMSGGATGATFGPVVDGANGGAGNGGGCSTGITVIGGNPIAAPSVLLGVSGSIVGDCGDRCPKSQGREKTVK